MKVHLGRANLMFLTIKNLFSIRFNFFKGPEDILKLNLLGSHCSPFTSPFSCIPNIQSRRGSPQSHSPLNIEFFQQNFVGLKYLHIILKYSQFLFIFGEYSSRNKHWLFTLQTDASRIEIKHMERQILRDVFLNIE